MPDKTNDGPRVEWDDWRGGLATFSGPAGFTQSSLKRSEAEAIAKALGVPFVVTSTGNEVSS